LTIFDGGLVSSPIVEKHQLSEMIAEDGPKQGLSPALDLIHKTWPEKTIIISEYGFEPHWNKLWGPPTSKLNADEYYFVSDDAPSDSEVADAVRRQLITEQLEIFRCKPFVTGAIFWTYQDYRTRSNFIMGLVDFNRNRRGSWEVLREEYVPALSALCLDNESLLICGFYLT